MSPTISQSQKGGESADSSLKPGSELASWQQGRPSEDEKGQAGRWDLSHLLYWPGSYQSFAALRELGKQFNAKYIETSPGVNCIFCNWVLLSSLIPPNTI